MTIGYRILPRQITVSKELLTAFSNIGSAQIGDCMQRLYGICGLTPMHRCQRPVAGLALTVKIRPGDNLMIHKAITLATELDLIVVDGAGDLTQAVFGELMLMDAAYRKIRGIVIDGAIRDSDIFAGQEEFACFAKGISLKGPYKDGPGEINVPISVGGQVVMPGDILVGDADGIIVVPQQHADDILKAAQAKEAIEQQSKEKLRAGTYKKDWVDQTIAQKTGVKA